MGSTPLAVATDNFGGRGALGGDLTAAFTPALGLVMMVGAGVGVGAFEDVEVAFWAFAAAAAFFAAFLPSSAPGALGGGASPAFFLSLGAMV